MNEGTLVPFLKNKCAVAWCKVVLNVSCRFHTIQTRTNYYAEIFRTESSNHLCWIYENNDCNVPTHTGQVSVGC